VLHRAGKSLVRVAIGSVNHCRGTGPMRDERHQEAEVEEQREADSRTRSSCEAEETDE